MSSELERRLEALLVEAPEPGPGVGERALERALASLPAPRRREHRRLRVALALAAAALGLLAVAAGSLAAAGALHVSIGRSRTHVSTPLTLPAGATGIAAVVGGRLSVVTRSGFRLQGLPVSAATLSPHALYVAAGIGSSLVAMRPDGGHAWSHPVGGRVVAIAWAPDGIRIAYVVREGRKLALHVIWGNGTHDAVVDRSVRPVTPSWRADSLAVAYVGGGGRAVVYDLVHRYRRVVAGAPADVSQVVFAPAGTRLAVLGDRAAFVGRTRFRTRFPLAGVGWLGRALALAGRQGQLAPIHLFGRIVSFESSGKTLAVVVAAAGGTRVLAGTMPHLATVLSLPPGARVESVSVR